MYNFDEIDDSYLDSINSQWERQIPWDENVNGVIVTPHALKRLKERMGIEPNRKNINRIVAAVISDKNKVVDTSGYKDVGIRTSFRDEKTGKNAILIYTYERSLNKFIVKTIIEDNSRKKMTVIRVTKKQKKRAL